MIWMVLKREVALNQAHGRCFFKFSFLKGIKRLYEEYNKLCPNVGCQDQAGKFTAASWALASCLQSICDGCDTSAMAQGRTQTWRWVSAGLGIRYSLPNWLDVNLIAGVMWVETNSIMTCPSVRSGDYHTGKGVKGGKKVIPREFPNLQSEGQCYQRTLQVLHHRPGLVGCAWGWASF